MSWCLKVFFREAYRKIKAIRESHFAFSTSRVLSVKKKYWARVGFCGATKKKFIVARHLKSFCSLLLACRRTIAQKCAKRNTCILFAKKKTERAKWRRERRFANLVRCVCVKFRGRWTFGSGKSQINAKKRLAVRQWKTLACRWDESWARNDVGEVINFSWNFVVN